MVLHQDQSLHERLLRVAHRRFTLDIVESWDELAERAAEAPPAAVLLVDPYFGSGNGKRPSGQLRSLLEAFPSATVIAILDTPSERYRDVLTLEEWGVAEICQADDDATPVALKRRILMARGQPLRRLLAHDPGFPLTGRARSLIDAAVETVMTGGHPRDLARNLGFSPSTLLRWCERSQLPNPRRLLLWMRILFASALLDDPGHTVFSVGQACGYSGDQALRRAIRSLVPYTPSELREMGAFETISGEFWKEVAEHRDDEADKR